MCRNANQGMTWLFLGRTQIIAIPDVFAGTQRLVASGCSGQGGTSIVIYFVMQINEFAFNA
ncbi:hypothetical protein PUN4_920019 [Paraburkholderia unamae]|nr:hypothetical protein PUN4_920019 [Paraburkholderia unamae]